MKNLSIERMEKINASTGMPEEACYGAGYALALGAVAIGVGVATGGLGFLVAGGIGAYAGTSAGLLCVMN